MDRESRSDEGEPGEPALEGSLGVCIVGAGIVGLTLAWTLRARNFSGPLAVLEKEPEVGSHQSGRNSGVLHSGIYYKAGTAKARLAVRGAALMRRFCEERGLPIANYGKVIVAVEERERAALRELLSRGESNGVQGLSLIGPDKLRELEPACAGIEALHVPSAAALNYRLVAEQLERELKALGVHVFKRCRFRGARRTEGRWSVQTDRGSAIADFLISCAGLYSDKVAISTGAEVRSRIIPFRGEYWDLKPERASLVRGLIYPVPDPRYPFLGVHWTRSVEGKVEAGPNAVLALGRESYKKGSLHWSECLETLTFPGLWRLGARTWSTALFEELRSQSRAIFTKSAQRLIPEVKAEDLVMGSAGIRAQALTRSGTLVDDFLLTEEPGALHVLNAPSPAATASLAIAEEIIERLARRSDFDGLPRPPS